MVPNESDLDFHVVQMISGGLDEQYHPHCFSCVCVCVCVCVCKLTRPGWNTDTQSISVRLSQARLPQVCVVDSTLLDVRISLPAPLGCF